ncbi:cell wall protein DAN4 [Hyalella azteca]|uniref:Cell wall protein DAN4 n=1 Tax=Hyalella azteca TaxID=294128 RepID=A0A8B7MXX7_HYAAZ|nr:cell wall protein DAN4 [Hyalella azteca]
MRSPCPAILIAFVFFVVPAMGQKYAKKEQPSLISSLLDLLPEVEAIASENNIEVNVPRIRKSQLDNISEIFDMFVPFMKEVIKNRADETGEEVSEETQRTIATMERLFPKLINFVIALSTRPQVNPSDEPSLPDYRSHTGKSYGSSEEEKSGTFVELPTVDKEVLKKVFNKTTKIISQISRAASSGERNKNSSGDNKRVSLRPYFIDNSSTTTTRRPYTPRRRTYTKPTSTTTKAPRTFGTYTAPAETTTTAPRTYGTPAAPTKDVTSSRNEATTAQSYPAEESDESSESYTRGADVPFFTLPTARRTSSQRVTRGSPYVDSPLTRQLKPSKYYYV